MKYRLLSLLIAFVTVSLNAVAFTVNGLNFNIKSGEAELTGATSKSITSLSIPATVMYKGKEYVVKYMNYKAFDNYKSLKTVRFEDSEWWMELSGTFYTPQTPFDNCPIEEFYVGRNIIAGSSQLKSILLMSSAPEVKVTCAGGISIVDTRMCHENFPSKVTELSIGGDTEEVAELLLAKTIALKKFTILPGEVFTIKKSNYEEAVVVDSLVYEGAQFTTRADIKAKNVTFGSAYETIPGSMYCDNEIIEEVIFSEGVKVIDQYAFYHCDSLRSVTYPSTLEEIGSLAFSGCVSLSDPVFNEGLNKIESSAYSGCTKIEKLMLPGTLSEVGSYAFQNMAGIKEITVKAAPDSTALTMGSSALGVGTFDRLVLDRKIVKQSSTYPFQNCSPRNIIFGGAWDEITSSIMAYNKVLETVELSEGVRIIGSSAFASCDSLRSVTYPSTLEEIGSSAFSGCVSLSDPSFNEGLKKIGSSAYSGCTKIEKLILPGTLSEVGSYAFQKMAGIKETLVVR